MADALVQDRVERLDREIERLHGCLRDLDRDGRNAKHTLWLALLGIPALFVVGYVGMVLVVLSAVALYATALYLIGVRRREYLGLIEDCKRDQERVRRRAEGSG